MVVKVCRNDWPMILPGQSSRADKSGMARMMAVSMDHHLFPGRYCAAYGAVLFLLGLLLYWAVLPNSVGAAISGGKITTRLVKIITGDDSGLPFGVPSRIAFDHRYQETYILAANGRITVYDKNFFPLGSIGVGRGVEHVAAMTVSPGGNLYLGRLIYPEGKGQQSIITIYNEALLVERDIPLAEIPQLVDFTVRDLAVAADGTIYLAGSHAFKHQGVAVLDSHGTFKEWMAPRGSVLRRLEPTDGEFDEDQPVGQMGMVDRVTDVGSVYIDVAGRIYLLSTELSEIFVYESNGQFHHKFGTKGGASSKLSTPRTLAVDYPRRLIYVVDYMRHTILAYDYEEGYFVYEFGGKGRGPLWYQHPNWLEVDKQGRVLVSDLFNKRVQVVDPSNPARPVFEEIIPELEAAPIVLAQVVELEPPVQLAGLKTPVGMAVVRSFLRIPSRELRVIEVRVRKQVVLATPSQPLLVAEGEALVLPGLIQPPSLPMVTAEPDSEGASAIGSLVRSVRSVAGVYGPVAALLEVGSWLLQKDEE